MTGLRESVPSSLEGQRNSLPDAKNFVKKVAQELAAHRQSASGQATFVKDNKLENIGLKIKVAPSPKFSVESPRSQADKSPGKIAKKTVLE